MHKMACKTHSWLISVSPVHIHFHACKYNPPQKKNSIKNRSVPMSSSLSCFDLYSSYVLLRDLDV